MRHHARTFSPARRKYYDAASYRRWVARAIGPRRVGGVYRAGYSGALYEVLAIEPGPRNAWPTWQMAVRTVGESELRRHCTEWDAERDQVVSQPEDESFALAWAAWQMTHDPNPWERREVDDPAWQHVLDEIAHPVSTAALRRLAHTARFPQSA
ncbi:hypothetical protein ACWC5I_41145 [Kitasatospora sp. NPDC001574]